MESLHNAKNLEITYDPQYKYVYCNWIGFQNNENILKSGAVILDLFKKHGYTKLLNDNSRVTGPWLAEWTSTTWFPEMINAGLKHFAWILSPDMFAEFSARKAMPASDVVKYFQSYDDAYEWLIKQK